jgi:hypothetical protein
VIVYHPEEKRRVELVRFFNFAYPYHGGTAGLLGGINLYASFTVFFQVFCEFFFQIFDRDIHCFACNYISDKSVFIGLLCLSEFKYLGVLISPIFPGPCVIINK